LRPIFLTTITTAAGLLPTAYGFGGNNPFLVPMIMSVAWGLIFATVITLFLIPALYLLLHRISKSSIALFIVQFKRNATT
jgi:multidrug efflux pump subunit AcrB